MTTKTSSERRRWLPIAPVADPTADVVRRRRLVILATIVPALLGASTLASAVLLERWPVVAVVGTALLAAVANLLVLRRGGKVRIAGATVVAVAYAIVVCGMTDGGGLWRGRIGWLAIVPLLAFLLLDLRTGRWITVAVGCTAMALWAVDAIGGGSGQVTWVLLDRLVMIVAAGAVGAAFAQVIALAADDVDTVHRSYTSEVETRRRAEEAAVAAGHAKTRFLGNMSHEIRTPMVGIMGMADLLLGTELNAIQRSYAQTLRQSGENLLAIINDILDFVKIDARKLELERVPVKLRTLVEDALELLDPLAHQRGIDLVTRFAPDTAETILGDPVRIRQILLNLIGNAIKFTETGHILVKVEIVVRSSPRRGVKFTVEDTGVGISPTKIERLFEPFTQADISISRAYGGTGLGLAICKQLTDLMGGEIGVESTQGKGSAFWFTVPGELAPPVHGVARALRPFRNKVVLVASEHAFTREAARDLALFLGARRVESAWKSSEITSVLRHEMMTPPDVVVVDSRMRSLSPLSWADAKGAIVVLLVPTGGRVPKSLIVDGNVRIAPIPVREKTFLTAIGHADPESPAPERRLTNARILVAEDVEVNRMVIRALAEQAGCQVDLARDGLEAVALVERHEYRLILMDCNMPEMDGYAATRKIRQLGYDEERLPIVALTANIMPGERERCEAAGMNDYLAKPVGQDQLERCFARWIRSTEAPEVSGGEGVAPAGPPPAAPGSVAAPEAATDAPVFDRTATLQRLGGNEELLFTIVRSFQEEAREILDEIRETLDRRDAEQLRSGAHKLKGALASVGGEAARGIAARLEATAKAGDLDPAPSFVARLVDEMERLEVELDCYVATRPS